MDKFFHRFSELFAQLGLPADAPNIASFICNNSPLDPGLSLQDASFWSAAQAALLKEKFLEDADWAEVVDQLNAALRAPRPTQTHLE